MYRLVVIDDEYLVVEGIKAMIARQKLQYEVVGWAYDGICGLEVVEREKPDLVITDIRIPGLDGLSLIESARESCPETIFVVISGYTEFEYARRALSMGVNAGGARLFLGARGEHGASGKPCRAGAAQEAV